MNKKELIEERAAEIVARLLSKYRGIEELYERGELLLLVRDIRSISDNAYHEISFDKESREKPDLMKEVFEAHKKVIEMKDEFGESIVTRIKKLRLPELLAEVKDIIYKSILEISRRLLSIENRGDTVKGSGLYQSLEFCFGRDRTWEVDIYSQTVFHYDEAKKKIYLILEETRKNVGTITVKNLNGGNDAVERITGAEVSRRLVKKLSRAGEGLITRSLDHHVSSVMSDLAWEKILREDRTFLIKDFKEYFRKIEED